jgi:hypothetical protein
VTVLAHGVGTRLDLPIPIGLALFGAGAAILFTFAVLLLFWRRPRLGGADAGRPLPERLQAVVDRGALRSALQAVVLAVAVFVVVVAFAGPDDTPHNLAPWVFYVTFWVGLVPASLLLGPIWQVVNPLRLLHRVLRPALPRAPGTARVPALGLWPATVSLFAFLWLELVSPHRSDPAVVGWFLTGYALVNLGLALWFGEEWFAAGDGFEVYSSVIARLSPWGRRDDDRLVFRNPMAGATNTPPRPGLAAVVVVLLGATAFDGLSRTVFWQNGPGASNDPVSGSLGMLAMIAVVAALYLLGTWLSGRLAGQPTGIQPRRYAATVIPIALGYTIAHYFSLFVLDGQTTWILASNPFGTAGTDLFGTYRNVVDLSVVSAATIALVQVCAIVVGHVVGVTLAHERALLSARRARASDQLPLVVVMVAFTFGGLGLLFGF